ncbi:P-loop containing nucleoside triphosphate hydrolase protein [Xylariaceae sp. FL1651]|nr:P-loop containing nucleoside triphosphate hydrolase protein [Xylariaceae sp. FL1651]
MAKRASDVPEILEAINDNTRLAEALSIVAENYLSIDILDQSKSVPQYVSYLLDTIQLLESQVQYYQAEEAAELPCDSPEDKKVPSSTSPITVSHVPRKQLLHRIFCGDPTHKHKTGISEDQPTQRAGHSGVLETKMSISNLETYLGLHPDICFIVFKEYNCATGQNPSILRQRNSYGPNSQSASSRRERIRIISPVLQRALRQVAEYSLYSPGPHNEDTREIDAPYLFLYHHRQKLAALVENDAYSEVLKTLLDFVEESYKEEYDEAEALFARNRVTPSHFSKLFKPNQVVVSRQDADTLTAAVLRYHPEMAGDKTIFSGWTWIFDGSYLRRSIWRGKMDQVFEDETSIADLPIHPADLARNEDIKKLEARGERFWELKNQSYLCYTGWNKTYDHHYTHKRFMIDVATYYLMHQSTSKDNTEISDNTIDTWPRKISRREELPLKAAILLPSSTYGFDLEEKNWVSLWVDQFHPIHWNKSAFERLVLEQKTKEMIHALVNVQTSTSNMDDIIVGKGNGLIVLLHGSPGTGKTLTAESVAEIAEKPLYRVTCGDIGVEASKVEKYLETVMYLGKLWDCILLLDEADVFLEERTMADLQRNSLVSVFLRILEYYEGIIILTSNRVGTFDEAFKSRIQVAIHYDNLTKKSRKQIWRNFFNMIEDSSGEDVNMPELERRLDELASEEMNGRQIRNALLTARQLAKHRNERLDWPHLSQVMKTSAAFNKYLKAVKGHSDEQWAREEQLR